MGRTTSLFNSTRRTRSIDSLNFKTVTCQMSGTLITVIKILPIDLNFKLSLNLHVIHTSSALHRNSSFGNSLAVSNWVLVNEIIGKWLPLRDFNGRLIPLWLWFVILKANVFLIGRVSLPNGGVVDVQLCLDGFGWALEKEILSQFTLFYSFHNWKILLIQI